MFVRDRCVNINTFIFALAILVAARANTRNTRSFHRLKASLTRFLRITSHLWIDAQQPTRTLRRDLVEGDRWIDRSKRTGRGGPLSGHKGGIYHWASLPRPDNKRHALCTQSKVRQGRSCCSNAVSWGRAGRRPAIHRRPTDRQPRQIGWERLYRERERERLVLSNRTNGAKVWWNKRGKAR